MVRMQQQLVSSWSHIIMNSRRYIQYSTTTLNTHDTTELPRWCHLQCWVITKQMSLGWGCYEWTWHCDWILVHLQGTDHYSLPIVISKRGIRELWRCISFGLFIFKLLVEVIKHLIKFKQAIYSVSMKAKDTANRQYILVLEICKCF